MDDGQNQGHPSPGNRRGLLGCGVDFLLRFLSVKALFQLGQFGFECRIVFFELADLDFQMFTQEKAPSSKAPGRTTITMHDKRLVCASDRRSGIAPAPLFRRATGLKLRTRQRNTEREIRGRDQAKVRRWRENEIPCGEPIAHQKPHSTKHRTEDHARAFLEETPNGVSFIARTAQRGTK